MEQAVVKPNFLKKWWPWLTLGIIILIVAIYFGWVYYSSKKATPTQTTTGKTTPTDLSTNTSADSISKTDNKKQNIVSKPDSEEKPIPVAIYTYDNDYNGKIDQINIRFNDYYMDKSITSTSGFSVNGYTISSENGSWNEFGLYPPPDPRANLPTFIIPIKEGSLPDTKTTPNVSYDAASGKIKNKSGSLVDNFSSTAAIGAHPVIISAVSSNLNNPSDIQDGKAKVILTFSEPVNIDPSLATNAAEAKAKYSNINNLDDNFSLSNNHTWYDKSGFVGSIILSSDKTVLTITLSGNNGNPTVSIGDQISGLSNYITSNSGNTLSSIVKIVGN